MSGGYNVDTVGMMGIYIYTVLGYIPSLQLT
jgi:hypothetical protein